VGSWSRGDAVFPVVTRAHFRRAVIMWAGSIRENEFLIFWLVLFGGSNIFACNEACKF